MVLTTKKSFPNNEEIVYSRIVGNLGGGVQSTAMMILAAQGRLAIPTWLFANVGEDSEHPATLAYVREILMPYAASNGLALHELAKRDRNGTIVSLKGFLEREASRSLTIPVSYEGSTKPGIARRNCTVDFKIKVLCSWLRKDGVTAKAPARSAIGISLDEMRRMRSHSAESIQRLWYPLVEMRLDRTACEGIIRAAGLPVPHKSACYFCPYHRIGEWKRMAKEEPDLFAKAVDLEQTLSDRSEHLGMGRAFMNAKRVMLPVLVREAKDGDADDSPGSCMSGFCESSSGTPPKE